MNTRNALLLVLTASLCANIYLRDELNACKFYRRKDGLALGMSSTTVIERIGQPKSREIGPRSGANVNDCGEPGEFDVWTYPYPDHFTIVSRPVNGMEIYIRKRDSTVCGGLH